MILSEPGIWIWFLLHFKSFGRENSAFEGEACVPVCCPALMYATVLCPFRRSAFTATWHRRSSSTCPSTSTSSSWASASSSSCSASCSAATCPGMNSHGVQCVLPSARAFHQRRHFKRSETDFKHQWWAKRRPQPLVEQEGEEPFITQWSVLSAKPTTEPHKGLKLMQVNAASEWGPVLSERATSSGRLGDDARRRADVYKNLARSEF